MLSLLLTFIEDENDSAFFIGLFNKYQNQMWLKATEVIKDRRLAEDAVQNAFMGVAKHIKTVRSLDEKFIRPYLLTSAKNAAIDLIKKTANEIVLENIFDKDLEISKNAILASEEKSLILHILDEIPQKYRDVLYFYFVLGLSEKEISNMLNLKINTVRQQVYRGRQMFIELYEKEMTEND